MNFSRIKKIFIPTILLFALSSLCNFSSATKMPSKNLIEQSCFAGFYTQNHVYGDGTAVQAAPYTQGVSAFNLNSRNYIEENQLNAEEKIENGFYSRDFHEYEFVNYNEDKYQSIINGDSINGTAWGPKDSPVNSTCKIRAYYHDIEYNNSLITLMFDFTGFLVGDSLLMTAAHGLYRDVTVDNFDDGISNYYYPGKVEVYGAIGMSDTWGSSYEYYAKGITVFMSTYYMAYRSFAYDWALVRLDKPLGRELSFRKLSTPMSHSGDYWIIGYPTFNQFHLRLQVSNTNYVIDSTRPMYEYNLSSVDGMSGSPFYLTGNENIFEYDSQGLPYLATRATYGMHVCSSSDYAIGYALTFSNDVIDLVDSLNSHYKPQNLELSFDALANQNLQEGEICLLNEYNCTINTHNCSLLNNNLVMSSTNDDSSYLSISFPFPVSDLIVVPSNNLQVLPTIDVEYVPCSQQSNYFDTISFNDGVYNLYATRINKITITFNSSSTLNLILQNINFYIDWDYIPGSSSAPHFLIDNYNSFIGTENCVSYAFIGLTNNPSETILPKDSNGNTLNVHRDLFPGRVIEGLKRVLLSLNIEMLEIGKYEACSTDSYKIAIVCDPYHYYHVIRQDSYVPWSHHLIGYSPSSIDTAGHAITSPDNARIYHIQDDSVPSQETYFDTSSFIGYFSVRSMENE